MESVKKAFKEGYDAGVGEAHPLNPYSQEAEGKEFRAFVEGYHAGKAVLGYESSVAP